MDPNFTAIPNGDRNIAQLYLWRVYHQAYYRTQSNCIKMPVHTFVKQNNVYSDGFCLNDAVALKMTVIPLERRSFPQQTKARLLADAFNFWTFWREDGVTNLSLWGHFKDTDCSCHPGRRRNGTINNIGGRSFSQVAYYDLVLFFHTRPSSTWWCLISARSND